MVKIITNLLINMFTGIVCSYSTPENLCVFASAVILLSASTLLHCFICEVKVVCSFVSFLRKGDNSDEIPSSDGKIIYNNNIQWENWFIALEISLSFFIIE